jgi:XPG N-terminal domain
MVVTGLEALTEKLQRNAPIDTLAHCGLGIDAHHYLRQLYNRDSIKSCLSAGLGGIPTSFRSEVEKDLGRFARLKIGLRFVFDGLDTYNFNLKDKSKWKKDPSIKMRMNAWDAWADLAGKGRYVDSKLRTELAKRAHDGFDAGRSMAIGTH